MTKSYLGQDKVQKEVELTIKLLIAFSPRSSNYSRDLHCVHRLCHEYYLDPHQKLWFVFTLSPACNHGNTATYDWRLLSLETMLDVISAQLQTCHIQWLAECLIFGIQLARHIKRLAECLTPVIQAETQTKRPAKPAKSQVWSITT